MQHRILWISPFRATLMAGAISFAVSFPFVGMVWILNQLSMTPARPNWLILAVFPPLVGVFAAIFAFFATVAHNFIARRGLAVVVEVAGVVENVPE